MPLTLLRAGESNRIRRITGSDEARRHLAALGFVAGELVTVVSETGRDMILSVKNSRIALDRATANRILI